MYILISRNSSIILISIVVWITKYFIIHGNITIIGIGKQYCCRTRNNIPHCPNNKFYGRQFYQAQRTKFWKKYNLVNSNLDIVNKSVRPFLFTISNVICLVNPQNGSWVLVTILRNSLYWSSLYQGLSYLLKW